MPTPEPLTWAEGCAVLGLDHEAASLILAGPLAPNANGLLDIRQILAAGIVTKLPMLKGEDAVAIGLTASVHARAEGPPRLLVVGWQGGQKPAGVWLSEPLKPDILNPLLVVPADAWLRSITEHLAEHRASAARPN